MTASNALRVIREVPLFDVPRLADCGGGGAEVEEAGAGGGGDGAEQEGHHRQVGLPDRLRLHQRATPKGGIEADLQLLQELVVARVLVVAVITTHESVGPGGYARRREGVGGVRARGVRADPRELHPGELMTGERLR